MRKKLFFFLITLVFSSAIHANTILILGDSLSAGYGIDLSEGWVSLLAKKMDKELPQKYDIVNASISGDTTSMGVGRISKLLETHKPSVVIIALGGNDGLQGHPLKVMRKNISAMVELSQGANAKVLLSGIQIPPNYGKRYTNEFFSSYSLIAEKYHVALVPFMLDKIAIYPELMQQDGIHPTAEAQPQLLENIWPHLEKLL